MRIIRFSELETIPWKNGGGVTREIAAVRENENIIWRLSIADVASDGPFSSFVGLTRILTVIEGNGIKLTSTDRTIEAALGAPVKFDGGQAIDSKLIDGPICDLNVMFDPKRCHADVILLKAPDHLKLQANSTQNIAIVGLEGETLVERKHPLRFGDTALMETGSMLLDFTEKASALIVTLNLLD